MHYTMERLTFPLIVPTWRPVLNYLYPESRSSPRVIHNLGRLWITPLPS